MTTMATMERILVVDDIASNRALIRSSLEDEACLVLEARDGPEALALFESERPDCVLLDINMPGMGGFEVCRRMRALPGGEEIPVLFVTAMRDVDTFDEAMLVGGMDFITKPIRPTELVTRVRAALALRRTSAERNDLAKLLRRQRDDLMRAVLVNERLAAFLVHDLKSPVAGMKLGAELIMRDPNLSPRSREAAELIRARTGELSRTILELLDISKGDEGRLVLKRARVDLGELVREVVAASALQIGSRGLRITTGADVGRIGVDVNLFRRVVENLLDNAIRHSPRDGDLAVTATMNGRDLELRVSDAGKGVPEEQREHIFDRFTQDDAATQARAGRGLGLAFCKLVVEAHGGRIWVEHGHPGATFCASWPDVQ